MLVENTTGVPGIEAVHGIALLVRLERKTILFDFGPEGVLLRNAARLGVDLDAVDMAVLSHGHNDHGGGLGDFLAVNRHAFVYARASAFEPHFSRRGSDVFAPIGLDSALLGHPRIRFTNDNVELEDGISLFTVPERAFPEPTANGNLYRLSSGNHVRDDFMHEQHLFLQERDRRVLVAGCAHAGIQNILARTEALGLGHPDALIGGFHLESRGSGLAESPEGVISIAERLRTGVGRSFTCHCTGSNAFAILSDALGDAVRWVGAGDVFTI